MAPRQFNVSNHFVPQFYLRNFACAPGLIQEYRLLVSHASVRPWTRRAIKSVACVDHLYTDVSAYEESDAIERWIQREYEDPAEEAIRLAIADAPMKPKHFFALARFFALQNVRTPKHYVYTRDFYTKHFERNTAQDVDQLIKQYAADKAAGTLRRKNKPHEDDRLMQFKTKIEPHPTDPKMAQIKVEFVAGRQAWLHSILFAMKRSQAMMHLLSHRWTVLRPALGMAFITSDHPTVRLGFNGDGSRNLTGGLAWPPGGVLLLPLSPSHILFTEIGTRAPERGTVLSAERTTQTNRAIAATALRHVYSAAETNMETIRKRYVNAEMFTAEKRELEDWHRQQTEAAKGTETQG